MTTLIARPTTRAAATVRLATTPETLRVPWSSVLPLAVVAALGNGFWLISVRGAIGAIERSQGPFVTWLLESALMLPLYLFAVLAAVAWALRWFGPGPLRPRAVAITLLLLATSSTVAAMAVQAANAIHDYRLQVQHVANMALHMPTCSAACVADREQSALLLQINALGLNGLVMLVSNLVLFGLVVALRGGRLDLATLRLGPARVSRFPRTELFMMCALLGTAAIHVTLVREQADRWPLMGIALLLLAIAEVDAALLFLLRLRSVPLLAAAVVSVAPLLLWSYSRTVGLPVGPGAGSASPLGLTDTATALLEVVTLLVAFAALRSRRPRRDDTPEHGMAAALAGVVAVTVAAVAVGVGLLGGEQATRLQQGDHIHSATAALLALTPVTGQSTDT